MQPDPPRHRPLERFWPYADLPEQPIGRRARPARSGSALKPCSARRRDPSRSRSCSRSSTIRGSTRRWRCARGAAEFRETGGGAAHRYRARFWSSDALRLRDLFDIVGRSDATEVLIDDRPVPYARELWLPLVWFLIPR